MLIFFPSFRLKGTNQPYAIQRLIIFKRNCRRYEQGRLEVAFSESTIRNYNEQQIYFFQKLQIIP